MWCRLYMPVSHAGYYTVHCPMSTSFLVHFISCAGFHNDGFSLLSPSPLLLYFYYLFIFTAILTVLSLLVSLIQIGVCWGALNSPEGLHFEVKIALQTHSFIHWKEHILLFLKKFMLTRVWTAICIYHRVVYIYTFPFFLVIFQYIMDHTIVLHICPLVNN